MKTINTIALVMIMAVAAVTNAETTEQQFNRLQGEEIITTNRESRKKVILAGMKFKGFKTDNTNFIYGRNNNISTAVSNGEVVCSFETFPISLLISSVSVGESPNSKRSQSKYDEYMYCTKVVKSKGDPIAEYEEALEHENQSIFLTAVERAIIRVGFDPKDFIIPSDFKSRKAVYPSSGGYGSGKDGLFVEGAKSICKIESSGGGLNADCVRK